jgi:AraC family transcriptional activator of pobA
MKRLRPVPSDGPLGEGRPVVVSRDAPADRLTPRAAPVTHSYAAAVLYTAGSARVEQNGQWQLGAGDVLLVPAGERHRMLELRRAEYWGLGFCVPCFAAEGAATLLEPLERVRDGASAVVRIPGARQAFLEGLFRELQQASDEPRASRDTRGAVQRSLLTLILAEIEQAGSASSFTSASASGGTVVAESLRYIERHCLRRLTLDDIATAVGRSSTYITAALTQATGRSAGEWIVAGRMAEARRLLLHSDEMIDVIAERVGYADSTHFIRMFRRAHGKTPAAWRAAHSTVTRK